MDTALLVHVYNAAELLATGDGSLRARLEESYVEFVVSLMEPNKWPGDLYQEAVSIRDLVANRPIRELSDSECLNLARSIFRLNCSIEREIAIKNSKAGYYDRE